MSEEKSEKRRDPRMDPDNLREILGIVSTEIPAMLKSIVSTVFSEEAGRSMGKAAAAYYKELKAGGLPEEVAIKLTEEYMQTFTNFGSILKLGGKGWGKHHVHSEEDDE